MAQVSLNENAQDEEEQADESTPDLLLQAETEEAEWKKKVAEQYAFLEAERAATRDGKFKWKVTDFQGSYHLCRMTKRFPVPGMALAEDRDREIGLKKRTEEKEKYYRSLQKEFSGVRGDVGVALENFKSQYGTRYYGYKNINEILSNRSTALIDEMLRSGREMRAFSAKDNTTTLEFFSYVRKGNVEDAKKILDRKLVDINVVNPKEFGRTVLMEACAHGQVSIVQLLLEYGADPEQRDTKGKGSMHAVWDLLYFSTDNNKILNLMRQKKTYLILEKLLDGGATIDMKDHDGETTLHFAARKKCTEICWLLLERGNQDLVKIKNNKGETPPDLVDDKKHEAYRLMTNWGNFDKARRLTEFLKEWTKYLKKDRLHPHLEIEKSAEQSLYELRLFNWSRFSGQVSSTITSNPSLLSDVVKERSQTDHDYIVPTSGDSHSLMSEVRLNREPPKVEKEIAPNQKQNLAEIIQQARKSYTPLYRERVAKEREKMKPSDRKLTLIEYLVGSEARRKGREYDECQRKERENKTLKARRTNAAHSLLNEKFKGRKALTGDGSTSSQSQKSNRSEVIDQLTRPWTVSSLGREGGTSRPHVLRKVGCNRSIDTFSPKQSTFVFAGRHALTSTADEESKSATTGNEQETVNKSAKLGSILTQEKESHTTFNSSELLPPKYEEKRIYSKLKREEGRKYSITKAELRDAINAIKAHHWDEPNLIPNRFGAALCNFVDDDDSIPAGNVTIQDLKAKFPYFIIENERIDTGPALRKIEIHLRALNQQGSLHSSLLPYTDRVKQHEQRLSIFHKRPPTTPWLKPKYKQVLENEVGSNPFASKPRKRVTSTYINNLLNCR